MKTILIADSAYGIGKVFAMELARTDTCVMAANHNQDSAGAQNVTMAAAS